jgi:hypothetical protein
MARIRTIKPEFPQSETIGSLSRDARLLFIQLWTFVDDAGRARASSRVLASVLYPFDDDAKELIDLWLAELVNNDCLFFYEHDGNRYLQITNWLKHQKIDRPSASRIPSPDTGIRETLASVHRTLDAGPRTMDLGYNNTSEAKASDNKIKKPKNIYSEEFEKFWEEYPKNANASKPNAQKEFNRLSAEDKILAIAALPQYKKSAGQYAKHAERYLRHRVFDNYKTSETVPTEKDKLVYLNYPEKALRLRIRRYLEGRLPWPDEFGWLPDDPRCDLPKDILLSEINSFKSNIVELTNQM